MYLRFLRALSMIQINSGSKIKNTFTPTAMGGTSEVGFKFLEQILNVKCIFSICVQIFCKVSKICTEN